MWPRTDGTAGPGADMTASRRSKNTALSGFVSYMKREDAEDALHELDGLEWGGSVLRVGWSKAVSLPNRPLYGKSRASLPINHKFYAAQLPPCRSESTGATQQIKGILESGLVAVL